MKCPYCHEAVREDEPHESLEGGALTAHARCLTEARRDGRPFRERTSFDDRAEDTKLREREIRE